MLNKTKIAAILLTLSLATTATSHAEEVSLERLVSHMLSQSIASVQEELSYDIQGAVLTVTNQFSLYEEETYATKISIIDLDSDIEATVMHEVE
ncbi:MAG: molecular chaperone DnaK (HSP70) [Paraglaciecola sp.]|jgi:molecular chaperone DnaK (HSP70)